MAHSLQTGSSDETFIKQIKENFPQIKSIPKYDGRDIFFNSNDLYTPAETDEERKRALPLNINIQKNETNDDIAMICGASNFASIMPQLADKGIKYLLLTDNDPILLEYIKTLHNTLTNKKTQDMNVEQFNSYFNRVLDLFAKTYHVPKDMLWTDIAWGEGEINKLRKLQDACKKITFIPCNIDMHDNNRMKKLG